ncbi:AMP-binding protein [Bacillus sp. Marseille-Q3570]|uniref:AMP-binding protein n=1 Tax=Bacillus sp. Marseille-Q3570 TaxID=2963522 RepID=UPI0021B74E36|nr:AMP-binding protein [Bacillus sp. Marseille-Q3570]
MIILDWITKQAKIHPNEIALKSEYGTITYDELIDKIDIAASLLYKRKPLTDGTIAIYFPENHMEFVIYFLAASSLGWKAVPIDPKLPIEKAKMILEDSEADVLVSDSQHQWWDGEMFLAGQELSYTFKMENIPKATPDSIFYLGYTSGTSGKPKGFIRTQESWTESFRNTAFEYKLRVGDQVIITGSLAHSLFLYGTLHALSTGSTVELLDHFSAEATAGRIRNDKRTIVYVVPTMLEALLNESYPQWEAVDLIISSGSKWNVERRRWIENTFSNAECIEFYGASELSFVSILHQDAVSTKVDSVGRPFTGVEVSIRDDQLQEVPYGEVGTLYVRSKMVFKGYQNLPAETANIFIDGEWATAGDLARMDEEGYIYLVGRANQMIISGGLNIYPEEVERVIQLVSAVEECAVIGVPDIYWGEKVVAFIKWRQGQEGRDALLKEICLQDLPKYKCPKEFITVDEFPYTVSRKIARKELIHLYPEGCGNRE